MTEIPLPKPPLLDIYFGPFWADYLTGFGDRFIDPGGWIINPREGILGDRVVGLEGGYLEL